MEVGQVLHYSVPLQGAPHLTKACRRLRLRYIAQDAVDPQRFVYYRIYQAQPQRWIKVVVEKGEVITAYRVRRLK